MVIVRSNGSPAGTRVLAASNGIDLTELLGIEQFTYVAQPGEWAKLLLVVDAKEVELRAGHVDFMVRNPANGLPEKVRAIEFADHRVIFHDDGSVETVPADARRLDGEVTS